MSRLSVLACRRQRQGAALMDRSAWTIDEEMTSAWRVTNGFRKRPAAFLGPLELPRDAAVWIERTSSRHVGTHKRTAEKASVQPSESGTRQDGWLRLALVSRTRFTFLPPVGGPSNLEFVWLNQLDSMTKQIFLEHGWLENHFFGGRIIRLTHQNNMDPRRKCRHLYFQMLARLLDLRYLGTSTTRPSFLAHLFAPWLVLYFKEIWTRELG